MRYRTERLMQIQIGTWSLVLGQASVNSRWVNNTIPRPPRSLGSARALLNKAGSPEMGALVGPPAMLTRQAAAAGEPTPNLICPYRKGPLSWKTFWNKRRKNRC
jgi:hypothetical protein